MKRSAHAGLFLATVVMAAVATLSWASGQEEKKAESQLFTETSPSTYQGEIAMWSWYEDWSKQLIGAFNRKYPNIKVNYVSYSFDDYYAKLRTALSGGIGAPDVIELEDSQIVWLIGSGELEDLSATPYRVDRSLFLDYSVPSFVDNANRLVALPESSGPSGIWYRRDIARKYLGSDEPAQVASIIGSKEPGYEKFMAAMVRVLEGSGGMVKGLATLEDMVDMMHRQKGNNFFEGNTIVYERLHRQNYQTLESIARQNLTARRGPRWDNPWLQAATDGLVAFWPGACWYLNYVVPVNDNTRGLWAIVPSPGPGWDWGSQGTGIWKKSKNKELAFQWLKWLNLSDEGQIEQWKVGSMIPVLKSTFQRSEIRQTDPTTNQRLLDVYLDISANITRMVRSQNDNAVLDVVSTVMPELEAGRLNGEEALTKVVDEALKRLKGITRP